MRLRLKRRAPLVGVVVAIALVVGAYFIGLNVGNGNINLSSTKSASGNLPSSLNYSSVNQVYRSLKDNYDGSLTTSQLINGLKHGLANATGDPYTEYFTPVEAKSFNSEISNSFSGIGAELGVDQDGNIEVISPISGYPAAQAGLMPKDIITAINGQSTSGLLLDDAVNKIRGPSGTPVTLSVVRNQSQSLRFTIKRQNISVPSVNYKTLSGNIGYIQITSFADDTSGLAQKAADSFKQANVKGIVLDLRDDPGGLLSAAVNVTSLWLPPGQKILDEKRGTQVVDSYYALGGDELHGIPTVVLINSGSASASEITTGALHDNHAAYVIGEKSYGKGVVQQLVNFNDGSELKVTIASWYRPDGENINHKGIKPDQNVSLSASQSQSGDDTQLNAAESYLASH